MTSLYRIQMLKNIYVHVYILFSLSGVGKPNLSRHVPIPSNSSCRSRRTLLSTSILQCPVGMCRYVGMCLNTPSPIISLYFCHKMIDFDGSPNISIVTNNKWGCLGMNDSIASDIHSSILCHFQPNHMQLHFFECSIYNSIRRCL